MMQANTIDIMLAGYNNCVTFSDCGQQISEDRWIFAELMALSSP